MTEACKKKKFRVTQVKCLIEVWVWLWLLFKNKKSSAKVFYSCGRWIKNTSKRK